MPRWTPHRLRLNLPTSGYAPGKAGLMNGKNQERLKYLCAQAAEEQDPERLSTLVRHIDELLEARQHQPNPDKETRRSTQDNRSQAPESPQDSIDTE